MDVNLLLWHNINHHNQNGLRQINAIAPDAMRRLLDYHWPGNVRELKNVIEYAFAVGRGQELSTEDLPPEFRETKNASHSEQPNILSQHKRLSEEDLIRDALQLAGGNLVIAANYAGMSRATFWRKRKKYNI